MSAKTDYLENALIDFLFRGQAFVPPANLHIALFTTLPTDSSAGVEVSGGSYARVSVAASLVEWAGTQAAASTTVSSGTNGTTSNNSDAVFPAPTANWGLVVGFAIMDAASAGNMWYYAALTASKTINNGDAAPSFAAAALTVQEDN